jgi:hypothetical protein
MRIQNKVALLGLQWSLGLVVLIEASLLAFAPAEIKAFSRTGIPDWVRMVLAGGEIFASVLFLIPRTLMIGGYSLFSIFVFAAAVHILHGKLGIGVLIVYAAAVIAVMTHKQNNPQDMIGCGK